MRVAVTPRVNAIKHNPAIPREDLDERSAAPITPNIPLRMAAAHSQGPKGGTMRPSALVKAKCAVTPMRATGSGWSGWPIGCNSCCAVALSVDPLHRPRSAVEASGDECANHLVRYCDRRTRCSIGVGPELMRRTANTSLFSKQSRMMAVSRPCWPGHEKP